MTPEDYWKFEGVLNAAIENIVSHSKGGSGNGLLNNGTDFSGAVARALYTIAINDTALRQIFLGKGMLYGKFVAISPDIADLAEEVLRLIGRRRIFILRFPTKRYLIKSLYKFPRIISLGKSALHLFSSEVSFNLQSDCMGRILCLTHHAKFVSLLKSVASTSGVPYVFLVANRSEMARYGLQESEVILMPEVSGNKLNPLGSKWPEISRYSNRIESLFVKSPPSLILYCEGDAWYQDVAGKVGQKYGIPSACLQWGAFPYETPRTGLRKMGCNYFLSWGTYFVKQLQTYNPLVRFIAIGNQTLRSQSKLDLSKKIVILMNTDSNGKADGIDAYHLPFFSIIEWLARKANDWLIVVRTHPTIALTSNEISILSKYTNVTLHDARVKSLVQSLDGADLALTVSSSAVVEAAVTGAVPFIFNPSPWRYQPDFESESSGFEVKSIDAAKHLLAMLLLDPEQITTRKIALHAFCKQLFEETGDRARSKLERTMKDILSVSIRNES